MVHDRSSLLLFNERARQIVNPGRVLAVAIVLERGNPRTDLRNEVEVVVELPLDEHARAILKNRLVRAYPLIDIYLRSAVRAHRPFSLKGNEIASVVESTKIHPFLTTHEDNPLDRKSK